MSDTPATLASEARGIQKSLKNSLKTKEPFDKEIDYHRKQLRRNYLTLLLSHPDAKEAQDIETHLWMQTSYSLISSYKNRIAVLDRRLSQTPPEGQKPPSSEGRQSGPVEYRKLLQRFQKYLTEEERFWIQLVIRLQRLYTLEEAQPALVSLGIISTATDGKPIEPLDTREAHQFPPEHIMSEPRPMSDVQRQIRLSILSKALVCLGDILRYREQYNESGGRSRVGHEDRPAPAKRGRKRGGNDSTPRPRNYTKAKNCYQQARLLVPSDGNPSHQLAIVATYEKDWFTSIAHCYRALCVAQPYETASNNLTVVMKKVWVAWKQKGPGRNDVAYEGPPKIRLNALHERMVILHTLWKDGLASHDGTMLRIMDQCFKIFKSLLLGPDLPVDHIIQIVSTSQGILWRPPQPDSSDHPENQAQLTPNAVETRILRHTVSLFRCLCEVGLEQLKEVVRPQPEDTDMAVLSQRRLNIVLRRMLPALRLSSKWLRANLEKVRIRRDPSVEESKQEAFVGLPAFWQVYADFIRMLSRAFAESDLPRFKGPLDEDVEMRGFLPLRNLLDYDGQTSLENQEHPNVLNLMRVSDLVNDAQTIYEVTDSPLAKFDGHFMVRGVESTFPSCEERGTSLHLIDEDPIPDAFAHLNKSDDEDEEQILYPRDAGVNRSSVFTQASPILLASTRIPPQSLPISPRMLPTATSPAVNSTPQPAPLNASPKAAKAKTAQDLLQDMMAGYHRPPAVEPSSGAPPSNAVALPSYLSSGGQSIWSASHEEQNLKLSPPSLNTSAKVYPTMQPRQVSANNNMAWSSPISRPTEAQAHIQPPMHSLHSPINSYEHGHMGFRSTAPPYEQVDRLGIRDSRMSSLYPALSFAQPAGYSQFASPATQQQHFLPASSAFSSSAPRYVDAAVPQARHAPAYLSGPLPPVMSSIWGGGG